MTAHQALHPVATLCRTLGVSPSGYYAWGKRPLSLRARADVELSALIAGIHGASRGTYGAPRIHAELAAQGIHVGRKRVARLRRTAELQGVSRRKFRNHRSRRHRAAGSGPRRSAVHRGRAGSAVGRGHHLRPHLGRLPVPRRRARCLEPPRHRLGHGNASAHRARPGRPRPGARPAPTDLGDSSLRPRLAVHLARPSVVGVVRRASGPRWAPWATPTTTPCARASSRPSSASCWIGIASGRRSTRVSPCLTSSKGWYNPRRRHSALKYLSPMIFERTSGIGDRTVASEATIDRGGAISVSPSMVLQ